VKDEEGCGTDIVSGFCLFRSSKGLRRTTTTLNRIANAPADIRIRHVLNTSQEKLESNCSLLNVYLQ
jgi:hypothetical protein